MNITSHPNRLPIVLSALVYPGLGQIFQRRWVAGTIYLLSFTVFFLMMMINVLVPLFKTLRAVLDFADGAANESLFGISPLGVLVPFGLSILIYVANLLDVTRAVRRNRAEAGAFSTPTVTSPRRERPLKAEAPR